MVVTVAELFLCVTGAINSGRLRPLLPALVPLTVALLFLHFTLRGKFVVWAALLDALNLRGDERVLDLGCGRGAVLLLAARRLTSGRAVGVDLWRNADQSGNSAKATRHNAVAEGIFDRVELFTADMTALPFEDNSFDLVVSSLAIHNIATRSGRARALEEAVRVLRPGGRLLIADVRGTKPYPARLTTLGMTDVTRRPLGWQFWWCGPWSPLRVVSATKPANPSPTRPH